MVWILSFRFVDTECDWNDFRELRKFKNSARRDELELEHWVKVADEVNTGAKNVLCAPVFVFWITYRVFVFQVQHPAEQFHLLARWIYSIPWWYALLFWKQHSFWTFFPDKEWTKEETDYLFFLAKDYDTRWYIIHDRYDFPDGKQRTMEVCLYHESTRSLFYVFERISKIGTIVSAEN